MIEAVIFDIDGTLIDSVDFHARAWQEVFHRHGCETSFLDVRHQIGKGGDKLMSVLMSPEQIDREGKQEERSELFKREYLSRGKPFPCLRELFERRKGDEKKIALASSAKKDELEAYKRITGIGPFLEAQTSWDDVSNSKPEPDIFLTVLDGRESVQLHEAIAMGDTSYDAEAAGKAGMSTIGMLCGGVSSDKLLAAGCTALYRDTAERLQKYDTSPLLADSTVGHTGSRGVRGTASCKSHAATSSRVLRLLLSPTQMCFRSPARRWRPINAE